MKQKMVCSAMMYVSCLFFAGVLFMSCAAAQNQGTQQASAHVCNVKSFGTQGNGTQKETVALQDAIA